MVAGIVFPMSKFGESKRGALNTINFSILFLQALFGWLFFGEVLGLNWFVGTSLAVAGGALLISGEKSAKAKPGKKDD